MKIIDLLNKIANEEEVPEKIFYAEQYWINRYPNDYEGLGYGGCLLNNVCLNNLNDEVEILEEEKKIPEKLPYYSLEKIQKAKNKDEWREERISLLEKRVEDLHIKMNDLLDYLKSKGE